MSGDAYPKSSITLGGRDMSPPAVKIIWDAPPVMRSSEMSVIGSSNATWLSGCSLLEATASRAWPSFVAASSMPLPVARLTISVVPSITQLKMWGNCSNHPMAPPNHLLKWFLALASAA
jgi:hypothetical protein